MLSILSLLLFFSLAGCTRAVSTLDSPPSSELTAVQPPPSATPRNAELQARLDQALADLPADYSPRTHHTDESGHALWSNRLLLEQSPYLIQHAHNPVDWHPWGDEAFDLARELGRPVLLSVGYATCHWCHVMERESFEDLEISAYINEHYIPIKVDREERPDVDEIYMSAVHLLNGRGGWPMTVWLTPDREPFYAGTYFPARDGDRGSKRPGFFTLLQKLSEIYIDQPHEVINQAQTLTAQLRRVMAPVGSGTRLPGSRDLNSALSITTKSFDSRWGGRSGSPKFPSSMPLRLLMRAHKKSGDPALLDMVELTLDRMAAGGIYDQIGGGFHRYSTDSKWLVPHFEKMLYDNALLAVIYLEASQVSGHGRHAAVARDILDYVEREMTRPDGGFWSATDADSMGPDGHREEGLFFVWKPSELLEVLGPERMAIAVAVYGVSDRGNFEGSNILTRGARLDAVAKKLSMDLATLEENLAQIRLDLRNARRLRPAPLLDDKMLTAWNGLMISAFAQGAQVLGDPDLNRVAIEAAEAVLRDNQIDGQLARSSRLGTARHTGLLDDHAFLCAGLLDLFESTSDPRWLDEAMHLDQELEERFEDPAGAFFRTPIGHEDLLVREKPTRDGAIPSGNSVHVKNLLRLAELTADARYTLRAEKAMRSLGVALKESPGSMDEFLLAVDWSRDSPLELIHILPEGSTSTLDSPFAAIISQRFLPNSVYIAVSEGAPQGAVAERVPLVKGKLSIDSLPTFYLCEQGSCQQPTTNAAVLSRQLDALESSESGVKPEP